jgi:hypothetical protein
MKWRTVRREACYLCLITLFTDQRTDTGKGDDPRGEVGVVPG